MNQHFASGGQLLGFSFSTSTSNGYSGLVSFRINWVFYILAVQGTFKCLQHHSSKAILCAQPSFMVQLSHPYMTTGKIIALTIQSLVGKMMSLLYNMLFVIAFLPRASVFNFMTSVSIHSDFRVQENEVCHCFHFFPIYLP